MIPADTKTVKIYTFHYKERDYQRNATITFINNKFDNCSFKTEEANYNEEDWIWLGELSAKMAELITLHNAVIAGKLSE